MTIAELAQRVAAWHMVTFPDHTAEEVAAKLLEEAFELQDARGDVNVADELADVMLVALALAGRAGLDIERALLEKFELNQERAHSGRWS